MANKLITINTLSDFKDNLGTAAIKDSTNVVAANSDNLVESGAVKFAIDAVINDTTSSSTTTYSSDKINDLLGAANASVWGFIEHLDVLAPSQRIERTDACATYTSVTVDKANGTYDLGSWYDWEWLRLNKPYMVHADGSVDYELSATDYTKKADGVTASDVDNTAYDGGAFSWGNLIYKYEKIDGNKRIVKFSMVPKAGFKPTGFVNPDGSIATGRWIPMFYASVVDGKATSIAGTQLSYDFDTAAQHNALTARNANAKFFGGAFVETLIDICYMLAGTTDIQGAFGSGNMNGYINDSSQYYGVKANAVVGGGQFYGTSDGKSLNKIFHSIVFGSYQQWMRDPYELVVNGRVKVSKNYVYDLTGAAYTDTEIDVPDTAASWKYPLEYIAIDEYGSIPDITKLGGSTSTGVTDGTYTITQSDRLAVALRFGCCFRGAAGGVRARCWYCTAAITYWGLGFAVLL